MFDSETSNRRAFLGVAAGSVAGMAGCTSALQGSDGGPTTSESGTTGEPGTSAASTATGTKTPSGTDSATSSTRGSGGDSRDPETLVYASDETTSYGVDLAGNPVMGSPDAPVDLYYWSDYQCPFCKKFEQDTFPKLLEKQIRPGNVRLVILEYPNIGQASETAARMSKCVWRQVREDDPMAFKRWHATMFDEQKKPNSGWAKTQNLLDITASVNGVDASTVESCLKNDAQAVKASVDEDERAGDSKGVQATPTFIFDDPTSNDLAPMIEGAQPYPRFEAVIQRAKS
ncbi:DsbA family protein [Halomicrococcus sp. NG-SE-24]|uniref:DsbA family protein n=1 Tax=Halomicrococcus sp. NG-SE-24 TaxID=3436928 RepID=UPI003D97B59D